MAKVFVSHRSTDADAARVLANEIRVHGHEVWLDEWHIQIGDSIIGKIDAGLAEADYVVLCYSDRGIESPWIAREWMSTLSRQLEGQSVKILPARLSGSPASILADIKYADLGKDWIRGVSELLAAIQ